MKLNKLIFLSTTIMFTCLSNLYAFDFVKDIKYVNVYSLSNHFSINNATLNEEHPNLFVGFNAWNNKEENGKSNINYGIGVMKNSFDNTSVYILGEYAYNTYKQGDFEIETGGKVYLTNGYDKEDMEAKNVSSRYVMDDDKLLVPGVFARFIYKKTYVDTTLIPGVVTLNFGFKF